MNRAQRRQQEKLARRRTAQSALARGNGSTPARTLVSRDPPSILVFVHGAMGDNIMAGAVLTALKRRWPAVHLVVHAFKLPGLNGHPAIDALVHAPHQTYDLQRLRQDHLAIVDLQYWPAVFPATLVRGARLRGASSSWAPLLGFESVTAWAAEAEKRAIKHADWYVGIPMTARDIVLANPKHILRVQEDVLELGLHWDDMQVPGLNLGVRPGFDPALSPMPNANANAPEMPYLTVSNRSNGGYSTKCWRDDRWGLVADALWEDGYEVVQVGLAHEDPLRSPDGDPLPRFTGNLVETADMIAGARLHLGIEGGLAHVAAAVRTPAVTLYGPTPVHAFAYPSTTPVVSADPSAGCWFETPDWYNLCPSSGTVHSASMDAITVEQVLTAVRETLDDTLQPIRREAEGSKDDRDEREIGRTDPGRLSTAGRLALA